MDMNLVISNKALFAILTTGTIVVAQGVNDFHSHRVKLTNMEVIEKEMIPVDRSVASEKVSRVAQIYLPLNPVNIKKINTTWEITRIVGADEKVTLDKNASPEDGRKPLKVKFELVGTSTVRVNNDSQLEYKISLLSDFGTIALFKKIGNGFEILEARRVQELNTAKALVVGEEVELVLERALNQARSNKVLVGNDVSGQVSLSAKSITGLSVELRNPSGETQNIEIDTADLMDGGAFKSEVNGEEVSGVVFNNGKDGYRISFVTGPLAGAMLNFVTKEQMEKVQDIEKDQVEQEAQTAADKVIEERKEVASNVESQEPVQVLSTEEIKETAAQNGFSF